MHSQALVKKTVSEGNHSQVKYFYANTHRLTYTHKCIPHRQVYHMKFAHTVMPVPHTMYYTSVCLSQSVHTLTLPKQLTC